MPFNDFVRKSIAIFPGVSRDVSASRLRHLVEPRLASWLDSATVGDFTGTITLQPRSTNPRPFSMSLAPITIHLIGEVRLTGDFNDDGKVRICTAVQLGEDLQP